MGAGNQWASYWHSYWRSYWILGPVSLEGKNKYGHSGLMFVLGENVHIVFDIIYWSICPKCFNLQQKRGKKLTMYERRKREGGFNSTNKKTTKSTHLKKKRELTYKRWLFNDFVLCNITNWQSTACGIYSKVYSHRNLIVFSFH